MEGKNPKDLCSQPANGNICSNTSIDNFLLSNQNKNQYQNINQNKINDNDIYNKNSNGSLDYSPFAKNVKLEFKKLFDPLTNIPTKSGKYWALEKIDDKDYVEKWQEIHKYEIINMDPNNIWDQYYRDSDPVIWQKNRDANSIEISRNIEQIHFSLVEPIRTRTKMIFGDNVFIKIEFCFMGPAALVKYKLKSDHLHAKARAVVLRIVNEKASMIYDDIVDWVTTNNDEMIDYAKTEKEKQLEPIQYGMLKLCNTEDEENQFIYITLPFTKQELEKDELLIHNQSNFYYTESNCFKMAPEPDTSTKIFPRYYEDNKVEEVFNKLDDLDEEISKKTKEVERQYKNKASNNTLETLQNQKFRLEYEKELLLNPKYKSDLQLEKEFLEKLIERYPNNKSNKTKLDKINENINRYIDENTINFNEAFNKLNNLEIYIKNQYNIEFDVSNYFKAKKLFYLKKAIECIKLDVFKPNEEEALKEIESANKLYKNLLQQRKTELYNSKYQTKVNELYPDGINPNQNIPVINVTVENDEIDMSDVRIPTKEEIIQKQKEAFDQLQIKLEDIYNNMKFEEINSLNITTKVNTIKYTELEVIDLENIEYNKFISLKDLVLENNTYKEVLNLKENLNSYKKLSEYVKEQNFNTELLSLFDDNNDYEVIKEYYFNKKYIENNTDPNIRTRIEDSYFFTNLLKEKNLDITLIPLNNTKEYAEFSLKYIDIAILFYTHKNDLDLVNKLNKLKEIWLKETKENNFKNINVNEILIKDIFNFSMLEYSVFKTKKINEYINDINKEADIRIINKLCELQMISNTELNKNISYIQCSNIGKDSFNDQNLKLNLNTFSNKLSKWLTENNLSISNTLQEQINNIISYIDAKINALNQFIIKFNECMTNILYTESDMVYLNRLFNSGNRFYKFIDYGIEYITLNEDIGKLKLNKEISNNEKEYQIKLKNDRLITKRTLSYIVMNENNKKIKNYLDELEADVEYNKINRVNEITNNIIPELERLNELREKYKNLKPSLDTEYETRKKLERERKQYLLSLDRRNVYLLYSFLTNDITMDFMNNRGIFENSFMNKDEKYIKYIETVIEILENDGSGDLSKEIYALKSELAYLKNENNERNIKLDLVKQEIKQKKLEIEKEIKKREQYPKYLHKMIWINKYEEDLKLRYKDFIKIESLPSTGPVFKYPFKLFNEIESEYKVYVAKKSPRKVKDPELLDMYRLYSSIHYNTFEIESEYYMEQINSLWKNCNYDPEILNSVSTKKIREYILCLSTTGNPNVLKHVTYCLRCIYGFIDMKPVSISENISNYDSALYLLIRRRKNDIIDDIYFLLKNLFNETMDDLLFDIVEQKKK